MSKKAKLLKKVEKAKAELNELESNYRTMLTKKANNVSEADITAHIKKLEALQERINSLMLEALKL